MKKLLAALLCVMMIVLLLPTGAMAAYSTTSNRGTALEYPAACDYFTSPFVAQVQAYRDGGAIYLMPMPESGHGNLGTVRTETSVLVLAEHDGFLFFVTGEGHYGWAWYEWLEYEGREDGFGPKEYWVREDVDYPLRSSHGTRLALPKEDSYFDEPLTMTVSELDSGRIHLMPTTMKGHGNLGVVASGEEVEVLAEQDGFYFFRTADGRCGWNGTRWFE